MLTTFAASLYCSFWIIPHYFDFIYQKLFYCGLENCFIADWKIVETERVLGLHSDTMEARTSALRCERGLGRSSISVEIC